MPQILCTRLCAEDAVIILKSRPRCEATFARARDAGLGELAADILARRVAGFDGDMKPLVEPALRHLADPARLPDVAMAVTRLETALREGAVIGIVTDYDVDGITAHALIRQALIGNFSHPVQSVRSYIGHRLLDGYGLSDNVCQKILDDETPPAVVITADCGSSDGARIERLAAAGIDVIVTDHHGIPDDGVPRHAIATVNPAREDGDYPDSAIAGCMVSWLLMCALRTALVRSGRLPPQAPKLADTLDLVALGTVADAVSLFSPSNRAVVRTGLAVLNRRQRPCWLALDRLLGRDGNRYDTEDLGFQIGPRINARGRMADPFAALNFLEATSVAEASHYLEILDQDNRDRRETEKAMLAVATARAESRLAPEDQVLCVYDEDFHPGVQGIVASRILDAYGRVTAVLSPAQDKGLVSGSLRSVDDVDVGQALKTIARAHPELLLRFGGHPKAAGVTLCVGDVEAFGDALAVAVRRQIGDTRLAPVLYHDGLLPPARINAQALRELATLDPYGRGFEPPLFCGEFLVDGARVVGGDPVHLSLQLSCARRRFRAIWFRALKQAGDAWPVETGDPIRCVFRLTVDTYRGGEAVQLVVRHAQRITD